MVLLMSCFPDALVQKCHQHAMTKGREKETNSPPTPLDSQMSKSANAVAKNNSTKKTKQSTMPLCVECEEKDTDPSSMLIWGTGIRAVPNVLE